MLFHLFVHSLLCGQVNLNSHPLNKNRYANFATVHSPLCDQPYHMQAVLWTLRLTPSTVIWRSGVIYGFDRQKLILRRNLRWFLFLTSDGRLYSYLRWETVSSWPGRARLDWLRAKQALLAWLPEDIYIYIANRKCCLWGNRSLSWHSEPLSTFDAAPLLTISLPPSVRPANFRQKKRVHAPLLELERIHKQWLI